MTVYSERLCVQSLPLFNIMDLLGWVTVIWGSPFYSSEGRCAFRRKVVQFGVMEKGTDWSQTDISIPVSLIAGCVSSGKLFNLSKPQFPHL